MSLRGFMAILIHLLTGIYLLCVVGLTIFSFGVLILLVLWWMHRNDMMEAPSTNTITWPHVMVQLPIYNERSVVKRLIDAVTNLDYPQGRLSIQVLDDSDDDTDIVVAQLVAHYARVGVDIQHINRGVRTGYKAGALAYGLEYSDAEFIVVFDADFVPDADFLRKTIPFFVADSELGILQTRWAHLNARQNFITRIQAMSIDRHFVIEQTARNRGNLLLSFNGSGGIWRRSCIDDAGGWSGETITEDLDLSYRAQILGWRYLYLPDISVRAEIPPQLTAFKRQQARWAKGTTQNLLRLLPRLWGNTQLSIAQKVMGTVHLAQYLPQLFLFIMVLLTPPLILAGVLEHLPLAPLGLISLLAPLMYIISQRRLYPDWKRRLIAFPVLLAVGSGVMLNNSIAIIAAFLGRPSVFKRTPKFSDKSWQKSRYALRPDWTMLFELVLVIYTIAGGFVALQMMPRLAPFLFGQAGGFAVIVAWELFEELKINFQWQFTGESTGTHSERIP
jgi:cellulose synthase/poly-beta-1,6-N-acetylglucosamine synthase-like glycosyltransferase